MIDHNGVRRLRVTAFGALGVILGIELVRAALSWRAGAGSLLPSGSTAALSAIVIVAAAILVRAALTRSEPAPLEHAGKLGRDDLQRERFRAIALLAAGAMENGKLIEQTLDFARRTLGMDASLIGVARNGRLTIIGGSGDAYPIGLEVPLARSFSRHVLASLGVLVIEDVRAEPWAADAAPAWQPWRAYAGTSILIGGERIGVLTFVKNEPLQYFDDADRDFVAVMGSLIGADLSRQHEERELTRLAFADSLTGLPNRAYFEDQVTRSVAQCRRDGSSFAVHYLDLDGFKAVNDRFGHESGDRVLTVIAARLKVAARLSDLVARHGGDEFVVLQRRYEGVSGASQLGRRLIEAAAEPILIRDEIVRLGASVGVACFPQDADTPQKLLRCADAAMYRAKNAGRNRLEVYA